ncbi:MAG: geranylgeranylglycerol-phosphate geranylgeranyltransferase [Urechidicola sp.]|nr:geranylgeranylglycerol-phosphate geranylgeranyltransferase [Urechidicola sp.]
MKLVHLLRLMRWQNLLMLIIIQLLFKFVLFKNYQIATSLTTFEFTLLVISIVFIAAGGNVINDLFDIETDKINKPTKVIVGVIFSKSQVKFTYAILTFTGVVVGIYFSYKLENPLTSFYFVVISILLFIYSAYFKKKALIGNLIVSLLIGFSIILLGMFDILPNSNNTNNLIAFNMILVYASFAFSLNLIREIIKDIEDIDGDYTVGMKTLPIIFGRKRTQNCTFFLSILFTFILIFTITFYRYLSDFLLGYGLLFIIAPLLYFCHQIYHADTKQDFKKLSFLLKLIMISGMLSIFII